VTGAAQGIGFAVAQRLASEGARVALCDMNKAGAEAAAGRLRSGGAETIGIELDISSEASVEACFDRISTALGKLKIVVNAAGIWSDYPIDEMSLQEWRRIHSVNVDGAFLVSRAALRIMKPEGYGRIVNIASTIFLDPHPRYSHYVASKGAVIGLTRVIAVEGGPHGITANVVAPGSIVTEGTLHTHKDEVFDAIVRTQAVPRRGEPADIAEAVAFLCAPGAGFTTGQTIYVNGGTHFG